ncbi:kinase-like domain-containing protein [Umbelopsis sp. PMI_123]|nr:kinase-like domain-containing protein [Umbelopsis sp. PMI_123]
MRKSASETTDALSQRRISGIIIPKRQSLGAIRQNQGEGRLSRGATRRQTAPVKVWRAPGHCEIPDILGKAYLRPALNKTLPKAPQPIPTKKHLQSTRPPWLSPCKNETIPELPPVSKQRPTFDFEKRIRKTIPKITLKTTNPRSQYTSELEIGTGVNGAVIQARSRGNSERLAIKRCQIDIADQDFRIAVLRELRIMASGHDNIIQLCELTLWRNELWIGMDLMRCSVFSVLCHRNIPEEFAVYMAREDVSYLRQVLQGLMFLHSRGYIHRDVKCENLLLGQNGQVKLADFGLTANTRHLNKERLGTSKWMAPEVIREVAYDEKIDLWSLGITIIEMMDRVPPHYAIRDEQEFFNIALNDPSPTFTYSYPSMYMRGLVAWLLEESPQSRPNARDVILEIDTHVQHGLLHSSTPEKLASFVEQVLAC